MKELIEQQAKHIEELTASVESLEFKISSVKAERDENMRIARYSIEELKAENTALRNSMQQANTAIAAGDSIIADLRAQLADQLQSETLALLAKNKELRAELAAAYETAETTARRQLARIEELMAQLAAAQKEAERYRFLKSGESEFFRVLIHPEAQGDTLDAALDAAISKEKSE